MAVSIDVLIERLYSDVAQQNGIPVDMQYRAAVESAVNDFSEVVGMVKSVEISVVSGTATYDLPADFISFIKFIGSFNDGILVPPGGKIIPLGSNVNSEQAFVNGGKLLLVPTPNYTADRDVLYLAGYTLDVSDVYQDLTSHLALIIAPKAAANLLKLVKTSAASGSFRFTFGDLTVDKSNATKALSEAAGQFEAEYASLVKKHNGPIGLRASFSSSEIAMFLKSQGM